MNSVSGRQDRQERIYWDQATALGLFDANTLPVAGAESARKGLDPTLPANALLERAARGH